MVHPTALNLSFIFLSAYDHLITHSAEIIEIALGQFRMPTGIIQLEAEHFFQHVQPNINGNVRT